MDKKNFAFTKTNYWLMAASMAVVIVGFVLMSGGESTPSAYDPTIFSARRIRVAPVVSLVGFVMMVVAILYSPREKDIKR